MNSSEELELLSRHGMKRFRVGTIFYDISSDFAVRPRPVQSAVSASQPARVTAMLLDYARFVDVDPTSWWQAGAIAFAINLMQTVSVRLGGATGEIKLLENISRPSIVRHAVMIMRHALGVDDGLIVDVGISPLLKHGGLGSSATLQIATAAAVNMIYGNRIPSANLIQYLIRNYGEEISGAEEELIRSPAVGAAAAAGLSGGGMVVVSGKARVIARIEIPEHLKFVIGVPRDYVGSDAVSSLAKDIVTYSRSFPGLTPAMPRPAHDLLHVLLPAMTEGDLKEVGSVISRHRLGLPQVARFEARYPGIGHAIAELLKLRAAGGADVVSMSSAGPTLFALTNTPEVVAEVFDRLAYRSQVVAPNNVGLTFITNPL